MNKSLISLYESHYKKNGAMSEGPMRFTPEERDAFLQELRSFSGLGKHVYRSGELAEITKKVGQLVEVACQVNLAETQEWFDQVTVKHHNKRLMEAYKIFERSSKEIGSLQQRLESAYEDIAEVLNKYYDV